jgi:hypothetical protein
MRLPSIAALLLTLSSTLAAPTDPCGDRFLQPRDEWQVDGLVTIYVTNGVNWTEKGEVLAETAGVCSE